MSPSALGITVGVGENEKVDACASAGAKVPSGAVVGAGTTAAGGTMVAMGGGLAPVLQPTPSTATARAANAKCNAPQGLRLGSLVDEDNMVLNLAQLLRRVSGRGPGIGCRVVYLRWVASERLAVCATRPTCD